MCNSGQFCLADIFEDDMIDRDIDAYDVAGLSAHLRVEMGTCLIAISTDLQQRDSLTAIIGIDDE